jgi:dihydropteroate synthase
MEKREWKIARRTLRFGERTLVMGVLNVTPDSFSDGGQFLNTDRAVARAEEMIAEGADIIDIGGESTRPGRAGVALVSAEEELRRVLPVIERLAKNSTVPISVDTTKAVIARAALDAGAEIVNDISGLRFDAEVADKAARFQAGLILMHSRGDLGTMHRLEPVEDIFAEVEASLRSSVAEAERRGVERERIAVDPGIGFSKSLEQNLELIAKLDRFARAFASFPILVGTSRKSFLGRLLDDALASERLHGTMATVTASILRGAHIVRVHDVKAAVETVRVADAIKKESRVGQLFDMADD